MQRDNFKCLICESATDALNVHHEKYGIDPWSVEDKYLKTLCFRCHEVVEICKTNNVKYIHFNKIPITEEKFVYLINSRYDGSGTKGKYVYVIHNLSGKFQPVRMYFSQQLVEYMLKTF